MTTIVIDETPIIEQYDAFMKSRNKSTFDKKVVSNLTTRTLTPNKVSSLERHDLIFEA